MKRKRFLACIFLLSALSTVPAQADNYFTLGENDTLWVVPNKVGHFFDFPVRAHFDGRLDFWYVSFIVPSEFDYVSMAPCSGMVIPYVTATGDSALYYAQLTQNTIDGLAASSYIPIIGYWDYDGNGTFEPYGTVKWEAGDYSEMFEMVFLVASSFTGGTITLSGNVSSGPDDRGGTVPNYPPNTFSRTVTVKVGYRRGDVNGDGHVSMDDLTALVNYLVYNDGLDAYQLEAADMNGNGTVDMNDLTILINYLVYNQGLSLDELEEALYGGTQMS